MALFSISTRWLFMHHSQIAGVHLVITLQDTMLQTPTLMGHYVTIIAWKIIENKGEFFWPW